MLLRRVLFIASLAFGLTGCFKAPTTGEYGRADFAYDEGILGCLFGCDLSAPMASRANVFIDVVNASELPTFTASSSDAAVFEIMQDEPGDRSIVAVSREPGVAYLVLEDQRTALIDRVRIEVADVERIELRSPELRSRLAIMVGGRESLSVDLFDARGRALKGFGAVDYATTAGLDATTVSLESALDEVLLRAFVGGAREGATLTALEVGSGSLEVTSPAGASLSISVDVVDADAVSRVELAGGSAEVGSALLIEARAFAADGEEIRDPACTWTVTSSSGELVTQSELRHTLRLVADAAAAGEVRCTIGSASATAAARFEAPAD